MKRVRQGLLGLLLLTSCSREGSQHEATAQDDGSVAGFDAAASSRTVDATAPHEPDAHASQNPAGMLDRDAGDAAAPATPGYCPGYAPADPASGPSTCNADSECANTGGFFILHCLLEAPSRCGGAAPPPSECAADSDCHPGLICQGACGHLTCGAGCTADSCGDDARCEQGRCLPLPCGGNVYACAATSTCAPDTARADAHGCAPLLCKTQGDCPCGSCVNGSCAPHPGFCINDSSPP